MRATIIDGKSYWMYSDARGKITIFRDTGKYTDARGREVTTADVVFDESGVIIILSEKPLEVPPNPSGRPRPTTCPSGSGKEGRHTAVQ